MPEVTFTPQASDYGDAQRAIFRQQLRSKRFVARVSILTVGVAVAIAVVLRAMGENMAFAALVALLSAAAGAAGLLGVLAGTYFLIPRRAARIFSQQRTLHHEMRTSWSDEGLGLKSPHGETHYPWSEFHGWSEGRDVVLIQASDLMCYFVPKRALDETLLDDLRGTLAASGLPRR